MRYRWTLASFSQFYYPRQGQAADLYVIGPLAAVGGRVFWDCIFTKYNVYIILYIIIWFLYKPRFLLFPLRFVCQHHGDCEAPAHQVFRSWWSWVPCRCFSTAMVMTNGRWSWRRRLRPNWLPLATTFWRFVALGCSIFSAGFFVKLKVDFDWILETGVGLDLYKTFELFFLTYALILYNIYKVRIYVILKKDL